jgi:hypothetical protein
MLHQQANCKWERKDYLPSQEGRHTKKRTQHQLFGEHYKLSQQKGRQKEFFPVIIVHGPLILPSNLTFSTTQLARFMQYNPGLTLPTPLSYSCCCYMFTTVTKQLYIENTLVFTCGVRVVQSYRDKATDWTILGLIPAQARGFSLLQNIHSSPAAQSASHSINIRGLSPGKMSRAQSQPQLVLRF